MEHERFLACFFVIVMIAEKKKKPESAAFKCVKHTKQLFIEYRFNYTIQLH